MYFDFTCTEPIQYEDVTKTLRGRAKQIVTKLFFVLLFVVLLCSAQAIIAKPIYINVSNLDNPTISAGGYGYGGAGAKVTGPDSFDLYVGVVGAHRSWPPGNNRLIFEDDDGYTLFGLRLSWVTFSNYYSYSTYHFELYTVDDAGVYSGPDWSAFNVTRIKVNQQWQLAYNSIGTDLVSYQVYVKGPDLHLAPFFGDSLSTLPDYEFSVEQSAQQTDAIKLFNVDTVSRSATLQVVNPHPDLSISLDVQNPVTVPAGAYETIPIQIDAASAPVGRYEDILLKVAVDDGSTLYSNITVFVTESGQADLPDLTVSSGDIRYNSGNAGNPGVLTATIHNRGSSSAANVQVDFYEFGSLLGTAVIDDIAGNSMVNTSITIPELTPGDHLIQVVIDSDETVPELNEGNNEASTIVQPPGLPGPTAGHILVTGSLPTTVYTDSLFTLSGKAVYDLIVDGSRNTDYVVKGGTVQITIRDEAGNEWVYGDVHTDINGNIRKSLLAPSALGGYHLIMTVSDKTFVGERELAFNVIEPPPPGSPPPAPPLPPLSTGSGQWDYNSATGGWTWTWTILPGEPTPQSDLRVFSDNIFFTNNHPAANEEITVFAEIQYWATSTGLVAEDIPVNIYATYPGSDPVKIGETTIDRLSVVSPDFGSRYVYATWKNQGDGIYLIEFEIDPVYSEENNLNNAATRAIIVGQLPAVGYGIISGQVTDAWGVGIASVPLRITLADGTLLTTAVTDAAGFYLVEDAPIGNTQVTIAAPVGYQPDAETKSAEVADSIVSTVDFLVFLNSAPVDSIPPELSLPEDIIMEATSPLGAEVSYSVFAVDDVDGAIIPTCAPASRSIFPLGLTSVACTASDAAGNTVSGSFNVTVVDTTPPILVCPADIILVEGEPIDLGAPTVSDIVDAAPTLSNNAPADFPLGATEVIWTAADASGNQASCGQLVTIDAPPLVNAGENLTVSSEERSNTIIRGTATDQDNDPLEYRWLEGGLEVLSWRPVNPNGEAYLDVCNTGLDQGQHTLTLEVKDAVVTVRDDMILTIDNSAPHAAPSGGGIYQIGAPVRVKGQVSDFDGDPLTYSWHEGETTYCNGEISSIEGGSPVSLPDCDLPYLELGSHTVTLSVADVINKPVSRDITIEIVDTTAPTLAPEPSVGMLWPPNHKMVNVIINANASDDSGLPVELSAVVTSNEPQEGLGDGDMTPDWTTPIIDQETGVIMLQLRAERSGLGDGRVYSIEITATDYAGNSSTTALEILVPHDQRWN